MPNQPEVWIIVSVAVVLVLGLAVWKHDRVVFSLQKIGIRFDAERKQGTKGGAIKTNVLEQAVLEKSSVDEVIGRSGPLSETGSEKSEIGVANKATIKESKIGRIVGDSRT